MTADEEEVLFKALRLMGVSRVSRKIKIRALSAMRSLKSYFDVTDDKLLALIEEQKAWMLRPMKASDLLAVWSSYEGGFNLDFEEGLKSGRIKRPGISTGEAEWRRSGSHFGIAPASSRQRL